MNDAARLDKITTAIARNNLAALRKVVTAENANWRDDRVRLRRGGFP